MLLAALIPAHAAVAIAIAHGAAFVILMFLRPEPRSTWGAPRLRRRRDRGPLGEERLPRPPRGDRLTVRTPWLLWTLLYATLWVLVVVGPEVLLPFLIRERIGEAHVCSAFLLAVYRSGGVPGSIFVSSRKLPRRYLTTMNLVRASAPFRSSSSSSPTSTGPDGVALRRRLRLQLRQRHLGTLLQRRVPRHMLGRVSSLDFFVSLALMPLSMAPRRALSEVLSLQVIFTVAGILTLAFGIIAIFAARMPQDEIAHPLED